MLPPYKLRYPKDLFSDLYRYISPWDIEKLSTEILINSSSNKHCPQTLANWKLITKSVNQIKSIEDQLYFNSPVKDVRFELFRISQLQFPEQVNTPNNQIIRFYNLYKSPLLRKEIEKALSINLEKLYTIALLIQGFFIEKPRLDTSNIADIEHITSIEISRFIEQFSTDIHNIRKLCSKDIYTIDYKYQFHFN
ncbi:MAG: hypothetical protein KC414_04470, partial [Romboutsia sp.]|nr:hypothetical protein [Romboutsia sp.]